MGDVLDFFRRKRAPIATWARFGDGDGAMRPRDMIQQILDPDTGNPDALVGLIDAGDCCIGYALTADEADELADLLKQCACELRARGKL